MRFGAQLGYKPIWPSQTLASRRVQSLSPPGLDIQHHPVKPIQWRQEVPIVFEQIGKSQFGWT